MLKYINIKKNYKITSIIILFKQAVLVKYLNVFDALKKNLTWIHFEIIYRDYTESISGAR